MECDTVLHKLHMCALKAAENQELVKSLAKNATVECEKCGALAKDPQNVCSPRQLPDIAWLGDGADQCKGC
jgi:uncharacterized Zn finger protein